MPTQAQITSWLNKLVSNLPSTEITYKRGATSITITNAVIGKTLFDVQDSYGAVQTDKSTDFIFAFSEIAATLGKPDRGDTITYTQNDLTYTHEVISPEYEFSDAYETLIRVHTKRVYDFDHVTDSNSNQVVNSSDAIVVA